MLKTERNMERLDKFLCDAGVGSRSQVKQILKAGRVTVKGTVIRDGSVKTDGADICLDGDAVGKKGLAVVMMNKPAGYVTARTDERQKTVMELLPEEMISWDLHPIGRLDKETEGLLLFTNDGDLLHRLISPKKGVQKVYYARHEGTAGDEDVAAFSQGIVLRDGTQCLPAMLQPIGEGESLITVCEGKYHQVRRMMASRGLHVTYLERREEGALTLGDLPRGAVRELSSEEILAL
ncbi:MAG: rRNA pseudouridine synthase [Ruminococcaceae bacterium]|nr:rRNA pseudouridine synthase [Oscillospiraceae bacterium]